MQPDKLVLGRYLLKEKIGQGGMGIVWRAEDQHVPRTVALKQAHRLDENGDRQELRWSKDVNAARVNHTNIVTVFDLSGEGADRWLVMEYVPGKSLAALLAGNGPLPPHQVAYLGAQIASALQAVHTAGVVHGDVKPANILITDTGTAKLTDFGISQAIYTQETLTDTDPIPGTPAYQAPEVRRRGRLTAASDMYSLGATLFTALQGAPPGEAQRQETTDPVHRALGTLLAAMLADKPDQRPTAELAARLLHDLVNATDPEPTTVPVIPQGGGWRRWMTGRRTLVGAAAVGVAVTSTVITVVLTGSPGASSASATPPGEVLVPKQRTADPCGLLSNNAVARFGNTSIDTHQENFGRCDMFVQTSKDQVDLQAVLLDPGSAPPEAAVRQGAIRVQHGTESDGDCTNFLILSDNTTIVMDAEDDGNGALDPKLCAIANSATQAAVTRLNTSGVPQRNGPFDPASLANLHACGLLDAGALAVVPGVNAAQGQSGYGDWSCEWDSDSTPTMVRLRFDQGEPPTTSQGRPLHLGSREAYLEPTLDGPNTCAVDVVDRTYTATNGDRIAEMVLLTVDGGNVPQVQSQLCNTAQNLGSSVAAALPGR